MHPLTQHRAGAGHRRNLDHAGEFVDHVFKLDAEHLVAATVDHVLDPVEHPQIPGFIHRSDIAAAPVAADKGRARCIRVVPVADGIAGAAYPQLARLTRLHFLPVRVQHPDINAGQQLADRFQRVIRAQLPGQRDSRKGFGAAKAVIEPQPRHGLGQFADRHLGQGSAAEKPDPPR